MIDPEHPALLRVRKLCLSLADTSEKLSHQTPHFFVGKRCFAAIWDNHHGDQRLAMWVAAPEGMQEQMVEADPEAFFRPPYVGHLGWLGVRLDRRLGWKAIEALVREGYATVAAKAPRKRSPARRR